MSRKAFWRTIFCFAAAILITLGVFMFLQGTSTEQLDAILITKTANTKYDFWNQVRRGAQAAAKEYEIALKIWGPENGADTDRQIALVRQAMEEAPDFIVLSAVDQAVLADVCTEVKENDIDLILMDSGISSEQRVEDCFVGIRNLEAASHLATQMAKHLDGTGQVAVLAPNQTSTTGIDRIAAIKKVFSGYPDIELAEIVICGDNAWMSYAQTKRLLADYPNLTGIIATNQMCTEGVARALQEEQQRDLAFFAFDTAPSQNEALEDGTADGFVVQQAFNMGYMSVEAGYLASRNLLRKGQIDPGWIYVTKENMRDDDIQKLIYPFQ